MGDLRRDMDEFHRKVKLRAHFTEPDTSSLPAKPVGCPHKSASQSSLVPPSGSSAQFSQVPTSSFNDDVSSQTSENARGEGLHRGPAPRGSTGPYKHRDFSLPSNWVPTNLPPAVTALVEFDELALAKATPTPPAHQNLIRAECQALKELKSRCDIIIKPADKGSAVVIMNVKD